jgi:hypothetical protein
MSPDRIIAAGLSCLLAFVGALLSADLLSVDTISSNSYYSFGSLTNNNPCQEENATRYAL